MKTNCEAVFFDVDDTLFDHSIHAIPESHLRSLHRLRQAGYKVCLSTGRPLGGLTSLGVLDAFDFDGYVCSSGAEIYDQNKQPLQLNYLSQEKVDQILQLAREKQYTIFAGGKKPLYFQVGEAAKRLLYAVGEFDFIQREPEADDQFSVMSLLTTDPIQMEGISLIHNKLSVDIMPEGVNKHTGIQFLLDHYHLHGYAAFGDSPNDVSMLKYATYPVAMPNSHPSLDSFEHCDQGIEEWLERNGFFQ